MLSINKNTRFPVKYFDNDEEFFKFCVVPVMVTNKETNDDGTSCFESDWDFTQEYKDAVKDGIRFIIKDENSQIYKHQAVTFNVITKPVDNLEYYIAELA